MELPTDIVASKLEIDDKNGKMKHNVGMALRIMNKRMNAIEQQVIGGASDIDSSQHGASDINIRYLLQMPFFYIDENTLSNFIGEFIGQISADSIFVNPLGQDDFMHDNGILGKDYMYCVKSNYIQVNKDSYVHFEEQDLSTSDTCSITLVSKYKQPLVKIELWGLSADDLEGGGRGVGNDITWNYTNNNAPYYYYTSTIKITRGTNDWSRLISINTIDQNGPMYITNVTFSTESGNGDGGIGTYISISQDISDVGISAMFSSLTLQDSNSIFIKNGANKLKTSVQNVHVISYYTYTYNNNYITVPRDSYIMLNTIEVSDYNTINIDIYTENTQNIENPTIEFYYNGLSILTRSETLQPSAVTSVIIPITVSTFTFNQIRILYVTGTLYISNIYPYNTIEQTGETITISNDSNIAMQSQFNPPTTPDSHFPIFIYGQATNENLLTTFTSTSPSYHKYTYNNYYITVPRDSFIMLNTIDMSSYNTINMDVYNTTNLTVEQSIDILLYNTTLSVLYTKNVVLVPNDSQTVLIPISAFNTSNIDEIDIYFNSFNGTVYISNIYAYIEITIRESITSADINNTLFFSPTLSLSTKGLLTIDGGYNETNSLFTLTFGTEPNYGYTLHGDSYISMNSDSYITFNDSVSDLSAYNTFYIQAAIGLHADAQAYVNSVDFILVDSNGSAISEVKIQALQPHEQSGIDNTIPSKVFEIIINKGVYNWKNFKAIHISGIDYENTVYISNIYAYGP